MEDLNELLLNARANVADVMEIFCPDKIALEYQKLDQALAL